MFSEKQQKLFSRIEKLGSKTMEKRKAGEKENNTESRGRSKTGFLKGTHLASASQDALCC